MLLPESVSVPVPLLVSVLAPVPICRVEDPDSRVCGPSWAGYAGVAEPGADAAKLLAEVDGAIAGVCNERGNVFGLMPHPERAVDPINGGTDGQPFFTAIVRRLAEVAG